MRHGRWQYVPDMEERSEGREGGDHALLIAGEKVKDRAGEEGGVISHKVQYDILGCFCDKEIAISDERSHLRKQLDKGCDKDGSTSDTVRSARGIRVLSDKGRVPGTSVRWGRFRAGARTLRFCEDDWFLGIEVHTFDLLVWQETHWRPDPLQASVDHTIFLRPTDFRKTSPEFKGNDVTVDILIFLVIIFVDE